MDTYQISPQQSGAKNGTFIRKFAATKPNVNAKIPISIILIANYILYPFLKLVPFSI